jgi:hypothetical protein
MAVENGLPRNGGWAKQHEWYQKVHARRKRGRIPELPLSDKWGPYSLVDS